jgi:hypothetical protein
MLSEFPLFAGDNGGKVGLNHLTATCWPTRIMIVWSKQEAEDSVKREGEEEAPLRSIYDRCLQKLF